MRLFLALVALLCIFFSAIGLFAGYFNVSQADEPTTGYSHIKKACGFAIPWPATVTCGELRTPQDDGGFFIAYAILHDDSSHYRPDPIVYLQGGPGVGARIHKEGIEAWLAWQEYADLGRDIILIDTRGTGHSRPYLQCAEYAAFNRSLMRKNLSLTDELAQGYEVAARCFTQLAKARSPIFHQAFSTAHNATDIRALIALLAYPEWNILGVSYGTRLALEIAQQEASTPQVVRLKSMVLDSVYPAGYGGVQTWPQVLDHAMQQFFVGCTARAACLGESKPLVALPERFREVLQRLKQHPMELTVPRWDGEVPITFLVNDHRFLSATFAAIYNPNDWPKIIAAMVGVEERDSAKLKPLIEPYLNNSFNTDFNSLTFMAVDCADNPILALQDYERQLVQFPAWSEYTRDQWRYQVCHALNQAGQQPLDFATSSVPALLLAGRLDPITPVQWAEELHRVLPNSQLVVRDHMAHSLLSSDTCLLSHLRYFFDEPTQVFSFCDQVEGKTQ